MISDDIIVYGRNQKEHGQLEAVLKRLEDKNLTLNKGKMESRTAVCV